MKTRAERVKFAGAPDDLRSRILSSVARAAMMVLFLAGCGARTAVDLPDATPEEEPDAGLLWTFPCRWSYGLEVVVAEEASPEEPVTGAVPAVFGEALVGTGAHASRVTLSASPVVLGSFAAPRTSPRFLSGADGYLVAYEDACRVYLTDRAGALVSDALELASEPCAIRQHRPGILDVATSTQALSVDLRVAEPVVTPLPTAAIGASHIAHDPARGTIALRPLDDDALALTRHDGAQLVLEGRAGGHGATLDRVRGAAVILYEHARDGFVLARVRFTGPLVPQTIATLPAPPAGRLGSNETEALVPLADGTVYYLELATERGAVTDRIEGLRFGAPLELVLRPGESAGGLVFRRPPETFFLPLVCNR